MESREIRTLINQAKWHWEQGEPLPLDLAAAMMEVGLDVETLERKYKD